MARDQKAWQADIRDALNAPAKVAGLSVTGLSEMLSVELGLFALTECAQGQPASDVWPLLFGYDFRPSSCLGSALPESLRWLLGQYKAEYKWAAALETYRAVPDHLRLFDIPGTDQPPQFRQVSLAPNRADVYRAAMHGMPPHRAQASWPARPDARYVAPRIDQQVTVPSTLHRVPGTASEAAPIE